MICKSCQEANGLEVCLFCGHAACSRHRGFKEGLVACADCLRAGSARTAPPLAAPATPALEPPPSPAPSAPPAAPLPAEEARPGRPGLALLLGALAAGAFGGYLHLYLTWLSGQRPLPEWLVPAAPLAAGGLVLLAVTAIARSKLA